jgi:hypothetical protein
LHKADRQGAVGARISGEELLKSFEDQHSLLRAFEEEHPRLHETLLEDIQQLSPSLTHRVRPKREPRRPQLQARHGSVKVPQDLMDHLIEIYSQIGESEDGSESEPKRDESRDEILTQMNKATEPAQTNVDECITYKKASPELNDYLNENAARASMIGFTCLQLVIQLYLLPSYLNSRESIYIRNRSPILVAIQSVGGMALSVLCCVGFSSAEVKYESILKLFVFLQSFLVPLIALLTALRSLRLAAMFKLNCAKISASETMPLTTEKSQSGWSSVFQVESKMIQSVAAASETRFLQLTVWSTIVLLLYSVMWVFLAEGKCDMQLVQTYNAIGVSALSIGGLMIGVVQLNGTREAFRMAYELKMTAFLHILFAVPQLAAFCLFTIDLVASDISAIAYVTYASIGVVWPITTACVQLYFPLALQERVDRYRRKVSKNEAAFRARFDDKANREVFFAYLDLEFCSELWLFWKEVEAFRTLSPAVLRTAARVMYNKFIRNGAMLDVRLDEDLVLESSWNMHSLEVIGSGMYDAAQNAVYVKMLCAFPRYLHFVALNPGILPQPPKITSPSPTILGPESSALSLGSDSSIFDIEDLSEKKSRQTSASGNLHRHADSQVSM